VLATENSYPGEGAQDSGDLRHNFPSIGATEHRGEGQLKFEPGANHDERIAAVIAVRDAGRNPFLEAASVLLRTLAEIPQKIETPADVQAFNRLLQDEVNSFTRICEQTNLRRDHMLAVRYGLCTALDEAVSQKSWGGGSKDRTGVWSTMALLNHFHGESEGGNRVFLLIGRLANSADEHMHVLEVMHHMLGLGFKGDYRTKTDGGRQLETIRHRLYTLVASSKAPVSRDLSPHWQGVGQGKFKLLRSIPVWVSASVLGLALFGQYAWFKYELLSKSSAIERDIEALSKLQPPASPPISALRLPQLLAPEILQARVRVEEDDRHALLVLNGNGMFSDGLTQLNTQTINLLTKIGQALSAMPGDIKVVGHTDHQPIKETRLAEFADNKVLSLKRAQAVSAVLQSNGVDAARIQLVGMGDTQPVNGNVNNASANRRVEISLLKAATETQPEKKPVSPASAPHVAEHKN
jgi:type VI secretion system protein ImpK